ncbi:hypothetical protein [Aureispira sp. CCB-QB1]|uniref:hypothetical protein n=1 Tax=Aureispira sp. CCB-QB1 TaxID=1313421 RepID=UPI0006972C14|nr:hypothetical protein [Aureispira sp. CCB-QB1]
MKSFYVFSIFAVFLFSCQNTTTKEDGNPTNQKPGIQMGNEDFNQFLYRKADMLPKVHIDSISINDDSYNVYITDTLLNHFNQVNILQNVNIILKDFCCFTFEDITFSQVKVVYQIPYRDSSGYFEVYKGSVEQTKHSLRMFANLSFSNTMKEIVLAHQEFPKIDVLSSLNMSLALVVAEEDKTKLEWFGIDCTNLVVGYLVECETKNGDYCKNKLESVLSSFIGKKGRKNPNRDIRIKIAERIREAFEKSCEILKNLPAQKVEEKVISL